MAKVEMVSVHMFDLGSCGVQEEDLSDQAGVRLIAYFEAMHNRTSLEDQIREALVQAGISAECHIDTVPETDWTTAWREFFKPVFPTPRLVICAPWERMPDPPDGFAIVIDPQMAFGTGHHETTRLALLGLEKKIRSDDRVLDVGTGSGILSIAAAKLGAAEVIGVDVEASAIDNARSNCILNEVNDRVVLAQESVESVSDSFDVVVANIISSILLPMVPQLTMRSRGCVILGGILDREHDAFCHTLKQSGLVIDEMLKDGEWLCAIAHKS